MKHCPPVYLSPGNQDAPVMNTLVNRPKLVYKRTCWCKINQGVKIPLWLIHWGIFTPWSICHQKVLSCKTVLRLPNTPRSWIFGVYTTKKKRLLNVFTTVESRFPNVFITRESFWTPGSCFTGGVISPGSHFGHLWVVLLIFRSIQQSLKGLSL